MSMLTRGDVYIDINDRNHTRFSVEDSLDNNDQSVDDDSHSNSTLTTTHYSYQQDHHDIDTETALTTTILDVETGNLSSISPSHSVSIIELVFPCGVLTFLTAKDLCRLSGVSRYCHLSCNQSYLWKKLQKNDFLSLHPSNDLDRDRDDTSSYHSIVTSATSYPPTAKLLYIRQYKEIKRSFDIKNSEHRQWLKVINTNRIKNTISSILDITQFRILVPLPFLCLFLSIVLFAEKLDNRISGSFWTCGIPLFIFFGYSGICFLVTMFLFTNRYNSNSTFQQHFYMLRSPFTILFNEESTNYKTYILLFSAIYSLLLIQLCLVCFKLDSEYEHRSYDRNLSWGTTLAPLWLLFIGYCLIPAMKILNELNGFFVGLAFVVIPFMIFFICLVVKLAIGNIRLSLFLMPFWVIEGCALVFSVVFLGLAIQRYRLGATENFNEVVGIVILMWSLISPFIIFQTLLSVKDDRSHLISHTEVVSPMLVVLGIAFVIAVISVFSLKTPFEEALEESIDSRAGISILHRL